MKLRRRVERYIRKVLDGSYVSGDLVRCAVRRHVVDLERGAARGLRFDWRSAERAAMAFPLLRHSTGRYAGLEFELRDWQAFLVAMLHGWLRADGTRRFRRVFWTVGRGNGKSPFVAANAIVLAFLEGEARAQVYCYATTRKQAGVVYEEAVRFAQSSPALWAALQKYDAYPKGPSLHMAATDSRIEPLASDGTNADGQIPHAVVCDELHEWREPMRSLWDKTVTSFGKSGRRQPVFLMITTAGDEDSHIWQEQLTEATRVVRQVEAPPADDAWAGDDLLAYVASIDEGDDIHDERVWAKANPMLLEPDSPVDVAHLRRLSTQARAGDRNAERLLRRYHLNARTSSAAKPIDPSGPAWARCGGPLPERLEDYPCWAGMDLARCRDFSAVTLVWLLDDGRRVMRTWAFTCEHRGESLSSGAFLDVLASPQVEIHPGGQIEFRRIEARIVELHERYNLLSLAYDERYATEMAQRLRDDHGITCVEQKQNPGTYTEPLDGFLAAVNEGTLLHGNCPVLAWSAGNLVVRSPSSGGSMPDKGRSENKIDPIVAGLMGWRESLAGGARPSYYDANPLEIG